jgi:hypothetical protein
MEVYMKAGEIGRTVLIITLIARGLLHAQQFYGGVLGGMNVADFELTYHERESQPTVRTQKFYGAGIILGARLMKYLSLQLEPTYQTFGGDYTESSGAEMAIRMRVLEIPLFLKADFGKNIGLYFITGPILNLKLDSELEANITGLPFKGSLNPILNNMVLGYGIGGGFSIPVWKGWLFFEGRYSFSLGNYNKEGTVEMTAYGFTIEIDSFPEDMLKFNNTQFMLGYVLPLGGK